MKPKKKKNCENREREKHNYWPIVIRIPCVFIFSKYECCHCVFWFDFAPLVLPMLVWCTLWLPTIICDIDDHFIVKKTLGQLLSTTLYSGNLWTTKMTQILQIIIIANYSFESMKINYSMQISICQIRSEQTCGKMLMCRQLPYIRYIYCINIYTCGCIVVRMGALNWLRLRHGPHSKNINMNNSVCSDAEEQ